MATASNTILVSQVTVSDLQVTELTAPTTAAIGASIDVNWTVVNSENASGATPVGNWTDRIILSTDAFVGNADDRRLADVSHSGVLEKGAAYTGNATVTLPSNLTGEFRIYVVTDFNNQVNELIFEDNNVSDPALVAVAVPDLVATRISVTPTEAIFGEIVEIVYEIENQGSADAAVSYSDTVFLSRDGSLGTATQISTTSSAGDVPLAPGESYIRTIITRMPLDASFTDGDYQIIVKADANDQQTESDESDSSNRASTIITLSQPAAADLSAEILTAPTEPATWPRGFGQLAYHERR